MQDQIDTQRFRRRLPRVVVGRVADAAEAEDHVASGEAALQGFDDARSLIAEVLDP